MRIYVERHNMATIKINGQDYSTDTLSKEARAQILSIQVTDQKINQLERDLAIAKTARNAYANALSELLKKP